MTSAAGTSVLGFFAQVVNEVQTDDGELSVNLRSQSGKIVANLKVGVDTSATASPKANSEISCPGIKLNGSGFIVTPEEATRLGVHESDRVKNHIRGYRNGRDLRARSRNVRVIDLFGLSEKEVKDRGGGPEIVKSSGGWFGCMPQHAVAKPRQNQPPWIIKNEKRPFCKAGKKKPVHCSTSFCVSQSARDCWAPCRRKWSHSVARDIIPTRRVPVIVPVAKKVRPISMAKRRPSSVRESVMKTREK
ncbi:MAG: hypothetical protein ACI9NQ_002062 [Paracoccaceae bacterium]|jgi:hypothetical protein